ncbi:hypothetical protein KC845_01625 [Candidatus Kaiserbacteria bacterium]|nr:hypothetical protein [Candidatus Kaiserbacteria bacterium]
MKLVIPQFKLKLRYLSLFIALFFLTVTHQAYAYQVTPLIIDKTLEPRSIESVPITITNTGSTPLRLYTTVNEIAVDADGNITDFIQPAIADNSKTVTSWTAISRARIEIPPGEKHVADLQIKIPAQAKPGEYHALISFASGSNRPKAEASVKNGQVPGTIVRIEVKDKSVTLLRLAKFSIDRFITGSEESKAEIILKNAGTKDINPNGEIIFYDTSGNEVFATPVNESHITINKDQQETLTVDLPEDMRFGKYKALLSLEYGDSQLAQLQDTTFFYVVPLYQLIGVFIILLILALFLALRVHRQYSVSDDEFDSFSSLPVYVRETTSEPQDHDIKLSKKTD